MLLENFNLDLEVEDTVKFEGYVIEGASPLWCASCAGNETIVINFVSKRSLLIFFMNYIFHFTTNIPGNVHNVLVLKSTSI